MKRAVFNRHLALALALVLVFAATATTATNGTSAATASERPARVVFFHIDGLHVDAPSKLGLRNFQQLSARGTTVAHYQLPIPWHPTTNGYWDISTTSFPNPVTYAGTLFLERWSEEEYLQEQFGGHQAHVANSTAYRSLNPGYDFVRLNRGDTDADVVAVTLDQVRQHKNLDMMRVVLQGTGTASQQVADARDGQPWAQDIWADGSPYIDAARTADRLLGEFVAGLERAGKLHDTLLVLLSDGQAVSGWHPVQAEDSGLAPLVFVGPGIATGRTLPYAETPDVAPTVAAVMGVAAPNAGEVETGRVLPVLSRQQATEGPARKLKTLNAQIRTHLRLRSWVLLNARSHPLLDTAYMRTENRLLDRPGAQFFGIERIPEWREAGSIDRMLADNQVVISYLEQALRDAGVGPVPPVRPY
nr:sulfatase-like hydrolase/transferase [Kibdelosporangium sp. MJ126-NF4]CEL17377.1 hypothetical protein [Kibdelosporangium sp. MJ126-NF4]